MRLCTCVCTCASHQQFTATSLFCAFNFLSVLLVRFIGLRDVYEHTSACVSQCARTCVCACAHTCARSTVFICRALSWWNSPTIQCARWKCYSLLIKLLPLFLRQPVLLTFPEYSAVKSPVLHSPALFIFSWTACLSSGSRSKHSQIPLAAAQQIADVSCRVRGLVGRHAHPHTLTPPPHPLTP